MGKKDKKNKNEETTATTTTTTTTTKSEQDISTSDLTDSNTNSASSVTGEDNEIYNNTKFEDGGEFNPFKNLSEKQINIFKQFKEKVWKDGNEKSTNTGFGEISEKEREWLEDGGDMLLLRYLRARDYDLSLSFNLLKNTLEWRSKYKPYEITAESLSYEASSGKQYVFGKSHGRSVIYLRPVRENTKNHDNQIRLMVYNIERAISLMDKTRGHEQIVLLIDFKNYSIRNSPPMSVSKYVLQILSDHYPERLGNAFLVETPFIFNVFWTTISPFINKVTYKKIVFANGEKQKIKVFSQFFEPNDLEKEFTGASDHEYDHHNYWKNEIILNRNERNLQPLSDDEILTILNSKE
ncbi:cellular retinaldehyde-binding/triple function domain-containing protein [Dictyostelium discoideum AX4]|uniref:Cellular retinaldehyde-binding/triple function domain-containing protein n=1 Tax=Dictyostelium discoideum TaxID=44689 RepID=Q54BI6_DICDI|nr:cellular retinaldehyde-binding/triple function domain-containing protein [Dictyostelium discoideum AX4]EAL60615.1 cellular retinaldehyde-binding/triple function domain-containing protein [Dictyostelium discoideum AX4]|eukprot:XP_629043.1 cellular retinaldehyde-binding/triple function domain-containing protein [Dictyostelium discoideum AX4]